MEQIYFNTTNDTKIKEIKEIFAGGTMEKEFLRYSIAEVLSHDIEEVIKAKAAEAYEKCRVPIVVEHGALYIEYLNYFPGPLSKPMWDLMNEKICKLIPDNESRKAKARSAVCFCNGKKRYVFIGETEGSISTIGKGSNGFQWDPIFIPHSSTKTYAEMDQTEKLKFSQAAKAYEQLKVFLKTI